MVTDCSRAVTQVTGREEAGAMPPAAATRGTVGTSRGPAPRVVSEEVRVHGNYASRVAEVLRVAALDVGPPADACAATLAPTAGGRWPTSRLN